MSAILKPALHTLWQSAVAAVVVWFGANLTDVEAVRNVSELERLGLSLALAVLAALLSVAKNLAKQYGPTFTARAKDNPAEAALIYEALTAVESAGSHAALADYKLPDPPAPEPPAAA